MDLNNPRRNTVPHKTPSNPNFDEWEYRNFEHLNNILYIFRKNFNDKDKIDSKNFQQFFNFFIYKNSSKYISPYLEELPKYVNLLYNDYKKE